MKYNDETTFFWPVCFCIIWWGLANWRDYHRALENDSHIQMQCQYHVRMYHQVHQVLCLPVPGMWLLLTRCREPEPLMCLKMLLNIISHVHFDVAVYEFLFNFLCGNSFELFGIFCYFLWCEVFHTCHIDTLVNHMDSHSSKVFDRVFIYLLHYCNAILGGMYIVNTWR